MRKLRTAPAGALLLGLVGLVLTPATASAGTWTDTDPYDPGPYVHDISRLKVSHGPQNLWVRTMYWPRVGRANVTRAWIDTRAGNAGPEFILIRNDLYPRHVSVHRVGRWNGPFWHERTCPQAGGSAPDGDVLMKAPRRCLKIGGRMPARVRVSVESWDEQFVRRTEDWAPRKERFGRHFVRSS